MAPPAELSFEEILKFMLEHNGRVTNHELVKHFKVFLMNPDMRDEARSTFKKHVNTLAIIKNQNNEKWLILKKKYMVNDEKENEEQVIKSPKVAVNDSEDAQIQPACEPPPPSQSTAREPSPIALNAPAEMSEDSSGAEDIPPKVVPRRRSAEPKLQNDVTCTSNVVTSPSPNSESAIHPDWSEPSLTSARSESDLPEEQKISVKERKQMFNRMASEGDMLQSHKLSFNTTSVDEEDRASLEHKESEPLDPQQKKWIVCAARGEYHALAKMCRENAKLARTKDPFTTAMHWACKRGDEDLVKLLAGVQRHIVNERSGYTPLHVATWFRRERVCRLLLEVYGADAEARDWAGKKPRQYLLHTDASLSPGSYRKKEGFLRIGSLNVRVKKTTEAFSNFLGVGAARTSAPPPAERRADHDRLKTWGSADNIQGGGGASGAAVMPPPSASKVRRRGASRRGPAPAPAPHSRSTPSTPDQPRAHIGASSADSDSDSAAGFHAAWRQQRAG